MSLANFLSLAGSVGSDLSLVSDTVAILAQNGAELASDAVGKGGFTAKATLGQLVEFQLTGLLVVFTVLGGLTLMCVVMAWLIKTLAPDQYHCRKAAAPVAAKPAATSPPASPAATPVASASVHPGLADDELVAILAVAATEVLGQAVSVVKFRTMDSMDWTWSVQGRVSLHDSHKL